MFVAEVHTPVPGLTHAPNMNFALITKNIAQMD